MPQCLGVGSLNILSTSPTANCLRIPEWQSSQVSHIKSSSLNRQPPFQYFLTTTQGSNRGTVREQKEETVIQDRKAILYSQDISTCKIQHSDQLTRTSLRPRRRNCPHARINNWPHSTVFTEQEKCCARSKSELMIKTSKSCDLNFANSGRDTEAKTSPRHLNFLKQLNETTEMLYPYISGFKIHQGTQWVPRNTVTEQIGHTIIRNLSIASAPRGSWKKKNFDGFSSL